MKRISNYDTKKLLTEWTIEDITNELNMLRKENGRLRKDRSRFLMQRNKARKERNIVAEELIGMVVAANTADWISD